MDELNKKELNKKELNIDKFSQRKSYHRGKTQRGKRPVSPWYYLIGKVERRYLDKEDCREDFSVDKFKPIKIKIKNKKGI